jgi:hypothetical protein
MADDIEKARNALDALNAAKAACDAAGITSRCRTFANSDESAFDVLAATAAEMLRYAERAAMPLAFGDTVEVRHYTGKKWSVAVKSIGPKMLTTADGERYRVSDGGGGGGYARIADADLARIKRDLVRKRPTKAAKGAMSDG